MNQNQKTCHFQPFIYYDYIQTKNKIKFIDNHISKPWILFSEEENNIMIYDVIDKKPIKVFNIQSFFNDKIEIKGVSWLLTNDKKYLQNYENNDNNKVKGIPFNLRSYIIIVTFEKSICFFNFMTLSIYKMIYSTDIENKDIIKTDIESYLNLIILNSDSSLVIWNLLHWNITNTINKTQIGKSISNFYIITKKDDTKALVITTTSGNLILADINRNDYKFTRLEQDKTQHDAIVTSVHFNSQTEICVSVSKNSLYIVNTDDIKQSKKIPNFSYFQGEKITGCIANHNTNFNKNTYLFYGKSSGFCTIEINAEKLKDKKIDSNEAKNLVSSFFDLETLNLQKQGESQFKIYCASYLHHSRDYLVLGTNKGTITLQYNHVILPNIVNCEKLNEINENTIFCISASNNSLISSENSMKHTDINVTFSKNTEVLVQSVVEQKNLHSFNFNRYKIDFSYEFNYLTVLDFTLSTIMLYEIQMNENLKYNLNYLRQFEATWIEWCSYLNVFAIVIPYQVQDIQNKEKKPKYKFNYKVTAFHVNEGKFESLYTFEEVVHPRIFSSLYLGIIQVSNTISFYNWSDKINDNPLLLSIPEIPQMCLFSKNLEFAVFTFDSYYSVYCKNGDKLKFQGNLRYKVHHGIIFEDFVFIFLNDKGVYFQILGNEMTYPIKLLTLSDNFNSYHMKISKKIQESASNITKSTKFQKILGISGNFVILASKMSEYSIIEFDHILFKIIQAFINKRLEEILPLLSLIEIKYIQLLKVILLNYLPKNEGLFRKIFQNQDIIEHFSLYSHFDFFISEFNEEKVVQGKKKAEVIYKSTILENMRNNNPEAINNLYKLSSDVGNKLSLLVSKFIDEQNLLKTLITHQKHFESFVFNQQYQINPQMGERILLKAYENLNQNKGNS